MKIALCHALAEQKAVEQGWEVHSYKACQRFVAGLDPALVTKKREGEKAFVDKHEPNLRRDYSTLDSNSLWCSDHYRFDVMVQDPQDATKTLRPWLTSWQDVRSRKILGYKIFAGDPNTDTILGAFVDAAAAAGLPKTAYIDNGKDYDSRALQGITKRQRRNQRAGSVSDGSATTQRVAGAFNILQTTVIHAWPYHGQSKPVERFHNTLTDRFCRQWDTYCGKDPQHKPENLSANIAAGKAPTLQELTQAFEAWLTGDYHGRVHSGDSMDGLTPEQAFHTHLHSKRTVTSEMLLFACMPRVGPLKVGQDGIIYKGIWYGGMDAQVQRLYGQQVYLAVDNSNLSRVLVLAADGKLLCSAAPNRKLSFDPNSQDLRDAIAEKKQLRKRVREYDQARPRLAMASDTHALLEHAAARRQLAEATDGLAPELSPPSISPVQTGYEQQQDEIARALNRLSEPLRMAVNDDLVSRDQDEPIDVSGSFMRMTSSDRDGDGDLRGDVFDRIASAMQGNEEDCAK